MERRTEDIKKYIESDKYLFLTGNSMYLFGTKIKTLGSDVYGLGIFDYNVEYLTDIISTFKNKYSGKTIYLEPGEAISLDTGFLISEVIDLVNIGNKASHEVGIQYELEQIEEAYRLFNQIVIAMYNVYFKE